MTGTEVTYRSLSGSEIHAVFGNIKFAELQMLKYAISRQKAPVYTMGSADMRAVARGARSINGALIFSHLSIGGLVNAMTKGGTKVFLSHDEQANYNATYQQNGTMSAAQKRALRAGGTLGYAGYVTEQGLQAFPGATAGAVQNGIQGAQNSLGNMALNTLGTQAPGNYAQSAVGGTFNPFAEGTSVFSEINYGSCTTPFLADQLPPFDITLVGIPETAHCNEAGGVKASMQSLVLRGVEIVSEASGTSIEDLVIEKQMSFLARSIRDWRNPDENYNPLG